jgi:hypothetical protein
MGHGKMPVYIGEYTEVVKIGMDYKYPCYLKMNSERKRTDYEFAGLYVDGNMRCSSNISLMPL